MNRRVGLRSVPSPAAKGIEGYGSCITRSQSLFGKFVGRVRPVDMRRWGALEAFHEFSEQVPVARAQIRKYET